MGTIETKDDLFDFNEEVPINAAEFSKIDRCYEAMFAFGKHGIRRDMEEAIREGRADVTPLGRKLIDEAAPKVLAQLVKEMEVWTSLRSSHNARVAQLIEEVGVEATAAISTMCITRWAASGTRKEQDIAKLGGLLANELEQEAKFRAIKKNDPKVLVWASKTLAIGAGSRRRKIAKMLSMLPEDEKPSWDSRDRLLVARLMLDLVISVSQLFVTKRVPKPGRRTMTVLVRLRPEVDAWLRDNLEAVVASRSSKLPVLHEPVDWSLDDNMGGYLPDRAAPLPLISSQRPLNKVAAKRNAGPVIESTNIVQRTPWRINAKVLDMVVWSAANGDKVGDLLLPQVPPKPENLDDSVPADDPRRLTFGQRLQAWWSQDDKARTAIRDLSKTLALGKLLRDEKAFWFPHQLDFRSRLYPVTSGALSPQGNKHQRAMLEFARGVRLGEKGLDALKFQAANTWGEDKLPLQGRIKWADDNEEMILSVASSPQTDLRWTQADDPWGFLAVCFDIYAAQEEGEDYVSHLPVSCDGASNGLQVLSLALRDPVGATATNCVPLETPNDIYMDAGRATKQVLEEWVSGELACTPKQLDAAVHFLRWIEAHCDGVIPRSYMKRPTMTVPYSAGLHSIQGYMAEAYHDQVRGMDLSKTDRHLGREVYQRLYYIGQAFEIGLSRVVVRGFETMKYLREVADIAASHGVHFSWETPLGFLVQQKYTKSVGKATRVRLLSSEGRRIQVRVPNKKSAYNVAKSKNSIVPNWVHSLDASALHSTVLVGRDYGIDDWLCIHDSIGTHAGNADKLYASIREGYIKTFSEDVLGKFHTELTRQLPEGATLPEPPAMGDLDINKLLTADFFFA